MRVDDRLEIKGIIEIDAYERGKKRRLVQQTHNIIVNNGRIFIIENLAAASFSGAGFTRQQNTVVRYIGFGLGGTRQTDPAAGSSPLSDAYPGGYGGANAQTDTDVTVPKLERPVLATATRWMKEVAAPATYPTATSVQWVATFDQADLNLAPYTSMPISEIALYKNSADPALPNGSSGTYPGTGGYTLAYDTFAPFPKSGFFDLVVRWSWIL